MGKKNINGLSPGLSKYSRPKERRSIKENIEKRAVGISNTLIDKTRVLQVIDINEMNFRKIEENTSKSISKIFEPGKKELLVNDIEKSKDFMRDRIDGKKSNHEALKLELKQETAQDLSFREASSKFKQQTGGLKETNKISDVQNGIIHEISEIKIQLAGLQNRLSQREELVRSKTLDNYSLHLKVNSLNIKLEKLKTERSIINTKCKMCGVF